MKIMALHTRTYVLTLHPYTLHFVIRDVRGRVTFCTSIDGFTSRTKLYYLNHNKVVIDFENQKLLYRCF